MPDNGFECKSGVLLWGQLHTVIEGYLSSEYDTPQEQPAPLEGGTILMRNYTYRVKAQIGKWHVLPIYSGSHSGYIVYHHDADPISIVRECKFVGISLHGNHKNKRIKYINRYDWSHHHQLTEDTQFLSLTDMTGSRFILSDADCDLDDLKRCHITNGVHLRVQDTEYELGWQVFNDNNELIAFVYDGYIMPFSENDLIVDNTIVITNKEYEKMLDVISDSEDDEYMQENEEELVDNDECMQENEEEFVDNDISEDERDSLDNVVYLHMKNNGFYNHKSENINFVKEDCTVAVYSGDTKLGYLKKEDARFILLNNHPIKNTHLRYDLITIELYRGN